MPKYFVVANSNAAPFVSDEDRGFVDGETPEDAMKRFVASYDHPAGLFSAALWRDANAFYERESSLLQWLSERAQKALVCSFCGADLTKGGSSHYNDLHACSKPECLKKYFEESRRLMQ